MFASFSLDRIAGNATSILYPRGWAQNRRKLGPAPSVEVFVSGNNSESMSLFCMRAIWKNEFMAAWRDGSRFLAPPQPMVVLAKTRCECHPPAPSGRSSHFGSSRLALMLKGHDGSNESRHCFVSGSIRGDREGEEEV